MVRIQPSINFSYEALTSDNTNPESWSSKLKPRWPPSPLQIVCLALTFLFSISVFHHYAETITPTSWSLTSQSTGVHGFGGYDSAKETGKDGWEEQWRALDKQELESMLGNAERRFLAKDSHASYGYNNVRYIFESTLALARITDRIPILPESVWARRCAVDSDTCTKHSLEHYKDRNSHQEELEVSWNEEGEIWKLGIEEFLDVPHLRSVYGPVFLLNEFFTLYGMNHSLIHPSGHWKQDLYTPEELTLSVLANDQFEKRPFVRVDETPSTQILSLDNDLGSSQGDNMTESKIVSESMQGRSVWSMQDAERFLEASENIRFDKANGEEVDSAERRAAFEEKITIEMQRKGLAALYTFSDELIMCKALALPVTEFAPFANLLPLRNSTLLQTFPSSNSLLYLPGDLHDQRKPGSIRFGSPQGRSEFIDIVHRGIRPPKRIRDMGEVLSKRVKERVSGRRWVAAHMRRGDFLGIDWAPDKDAATHFNKTRQALARGIELLKLHYPAEELPLPDDPFYLATDEEDPDALELYRSHGAIILRDLFTSEDAKVLGWQASFVDLLALVEQQVLAKSDFFVGSQLSSTTGGAINVRIANGGPPWSWSLLGRGP